MIAMRFETVIGLEIHVQLKTQTKMFCGCLNKAEEYDPNSNVCPICMGHPGVLPVTNRQAVEFALMLAQELGFTIRRDSKFDRKHYFYPDLPKGYQISQYDEPIAESGKFVFWTGKKRKAIRFERLHLEEDAAKLIHLPGSKTSLVDFNRAGTPLIEMVTKPDFETAEEARVFLQELRLIVRTLGISDGDMEKGHLRCDANVSLRPTPETFIAMQKAGQLSGERRVLWPKTEIKNMNSFKSVEHALEYEIERQTALWQKGQPPLEQSTRGWNDDEGATTLQRTKESTEDYRYLPEPDLPRLIIDEEWLDQLIAELPELPQSRRDRFDEQYQLEPDIRDILIEQKQTADFFENVVSEIKAWLLAKKPRHVISKQDKEAMVKLAGSWIVTKLFEVLAKQSLDFGTMKLDAENFAELLYLLHVKSINSSTAMTLLTEMVTKGADPSQLVRERGLSQIGDEGELKKIIDHVLQANTDHVASYKSGKTSLLQFFIGQVMKETKGRADPEKVKTMLEVFLR